MGQLTKAQKKERARQKAKDGKLKHSIEHKNEKKHRQREAMLLQLEGIGCTSEEQKTFFIKEQKHKYKEGIQRLKLACTSDSTPKLIIDLAYQDKMSHTEIKSLASQLNLTVFELKKYQYTMGMHIVGYEDERLKELVENRGGKSWGCIYHAQSLMEAFRDRQGIENEEISYSSDQHQYSIDWSNTFYLSPDASEPLLNFDTHTNFIIGGLIDRTVIKNASLSMAQGYELQARRLPIEEYSEEKVSKKALSINQVVQILMIYKESGGDWARAMREAIPKRVKVQQLHTNIIASPTDSTIDQ